MNLSPSRAALAEALLASLVFIGLLGFSTYMIYQKSLSALEQEIKIGLMSNVRASASTLSGDAHQLITANTPRDDVHYAALAAQLERIRQSSQDVRYIYTTVLEQGRVLFVVNPSPQNDNDGDGQPDLPPALMQVYDNAPEELVTALREQRAGVSQLPYRDEWGVFISAYAPFYDRQGAFRGVLAMDLELSSFYQRLAALNLVFRKAIVIIFFLGLVGGLAIWWMRRSSQQVRQRLTQREQEYDILQRATSPLHLARLYDWPMPLLFLRGGVHAWPPATPSVSTAPLSQGAVSSSARQPLAEPPSPPESAPVQQHSLSRWWREVAPGLLPCADSRLTVSLADPLDAAFSPEAQQRFWRESFQLWRRLAQQPVAIDIVLQEEALLHWRLAVRLAVVGTPDRQADDDTNWWGAFLRWQEAAAVARVILSHVDHGELCLIWLVDKYTEAP